MVRTVSRLSRRGRNVLAFVVGALAIVAVTGCEDPNFLESQIRISVKNESAATVYWVKAPAGAGEDATVRGPHQPIPPGSTSVIGVGGVEVDPGAGGCFRDEQLWIVSSRTDARYDVDDPPSADDVVIIDHWDGATCFDISEVSVTVP